ncbi:MAG TPA: hypothetical protein ENG67_06330 [candidate division WOR-3 bacterium]|uniref:DUF1302 family protein n=1 Tax=candidate division WOR-3 bacterium TaxID=2052148 RepID=A0A7C1BEQ5_UNCW3|nr:hypothetical protein [candidate division WOR-3 bacterium]
MKKEILLTLLCALPLWAGVNGFVETYNRYWVNADSGRWTWNENSFQALFEGAPSEKLHYYAELRFRTFGFPGISSLSDLQRKEKDRVFPYSLELKEAYADIYGFLLDDLDLRIGKQIIAWGTADKINPTSNLSPYDLEDFFDFGAKLGVNSLKATYTKDPWSFDLCFVPVFTPSTMPPPEYADVLFGGTGLSGDYQIRNFSDTIMMPENKITEASEAGSRVSTNIYNWDLSLSYFHGYIGFPLPEKAEMIPDSSSGTVDVRTFLSYPEVDVIGADFSGSLFGLGFWGEGALFVPEDYVLTREIVTPQGPVSSVDTILRRDEPYLKFVLGSDYTFGDGTYINAQYIHGFIHENGRDSLNDYLVFRLEKKFLNDELKIAPLSFAACVTDWGEPGDNYGFVWIPEIEYKPQDNIELTLGAFVIDGKGTGMFPRMKEHDELYFKTKLSF